MTASGTLSRISLNQFDFQTIQANGINIRYVAIGELNHDKSNLVLFCHGWPESWYSWRHQLLALSQAGYYCIAPDMRGYGGTDAPPQVESYTLLHLVGDMVGLLKALNVKNACVVGHDWGAPVAWNCALLRPDVFTRVVGMSVPWTPHGSIDFLSALEKRGVHSFYMQYFQHEGVAEAEFEEDVEHSLRCIYFTASGDAPDGHPGFGMLKEGGGFLANTTNPRALPSWFSQVDLDYLSDEFKRAGFRGGLNWYRNLRRSWGLMAPWRGQVIQQPSMFIAGERDGVLKFPASQAQIQAFSQTLPGIKACHIIAGAGHWIQQEKAETVSNMLLDFLKTN